MRKSEGLYVEYGTTRIPFILEYKNRKTLSIAVTPDKRVTITAPYDSQLEKVLEKVSKRASWISTQIRKFESYETTLLARKIEYVSGETFHYMGRKHRLKVVKGDAEMVMRQGKFIRVFVKDNSEKYIADLLMAWYQDEAKRVFLERLTRYDYILKREKISINQLLVRRLAKRWGSCTEIGNIVLNLSLIQAPVQCIDYVIVHELCHLKYLNHGPKFYNMLTRYMEDWEKRRGRLQTVRIFK